MSVRKTYFCPEVTVQPSYCELVSERMQAATGAEPKLWGTTIVGFGHYCIKELIQRGVEATT
jgi:hypothetical protein